jgi:hypothetical protein
MDIPEFLDLRKTDREACAILGWFLRNALDSYLDQNTHTIIKSIKSDVPSPQIKEFLYSYENTHKKRKDVLEALK